MKISKDTILLYWAKFSDLLPCKEILFKYLSKTEQSRFSAYTNIEAANRAIISRASLRMILGKYFSIQANKVDIKYGLHGKPYLEVCNDIHNVDKDKQHLYFNVSHSDEVLVLAFSRSEIGVDVESYSRSVNYNQIMKRFFSETEIENWQNNKGDKPKNSFLLGWTRKEAILKATGDGMLGIQKAEISFFTLKQPEVAQYDNQRWFLYDFKSIPNHVVSVASDSRTKQICDKCLKETLLVDLNSKQI